MIDWTDRHCRFFHRQITPRAMLYTEMIVADAILHGDREHILGFDNQEHPVALQLGGSDPEKLAQAARIGADFGFDMINLNIGCPSDRVRSGAFGACLMRDPPLVAACVAAMKEAVSVPVSVKCRIGVDEQEPHEILPRFIETLSQAGCAHFIIHARKAWLDGLSPKQNRSVPPLDYELVYGIKKSFPDLSIMLNGGVRDVAAAQTHLSHLDGVMIGRAAYEQPFSLAEFDRVLLGGERGRPTRRDIVEAMIPYLARLCAQGDKPHRVTRHMLGLFHGQPGARKWRQFLTVEGVRDGAGPEVLEKALAMMPEQSLNHGQEEATGSSDGIFKR